MKISKLRRTLAVFLSAMMVMLCIPMTVSAEEISEVTVIVDTSSLPTSLIAGQSLTGEEANRICSSFASSGDYTFNEATIGICDSSGNSIFDEETNTYAPFELGQSYYFRWRLIIATDGTTFAPEGTLKVKVSGTDSELNYERTSDTEIVVIYPLGTAVEGSSDSSEYDVTTDQIKAAGYMDIEPGKKIYVNTDTFKTGRKKFYADTYESAVAAGYIDDNNIDSNYLYYYQEELTYGSIITLKSKYQANVDGDGDVLCGGTWRCTVDGEDNGVLEIYSTTPSKDCPDPDDPSTDGNVITAVTVNVDTEALPDEMVAGEEIDYSITDAFTVSENANYEIDDCWIADSECGNSHIYAASTDYYVWIAIKPATDYSFDSNVTASSADGKLIKMAINDDGYLVVRYPLGTTTASSGDDDDDDNGYITDSNGIMSYLYKSGNFDIQGKFNGNWRPTTYEDEGYETKIKVGDNYYDVNAAPFDSANALDNGLKVGIDLQFVNDGKQIKVVYTVKNTGDSAVDYALASGADVQIGDDDGAVITPFSDTKGFKMVSRGGDDDEDYPLDHYTKPNGTEDYAQFNFFGDSKYSGVTGVSALWYGSFGNYNSYQNGTLFIYGSNECETAAEGEYLDSAMTWRWENNSIGAGETQTFSVLIGIGGAGSENISGSEEENEHTHNYEWKFDEDGHWQECTECGDTTAKCAHVWGESSGFTTSDMTCSVCGYSYTALIDQIFPGKNSEGGSSSSGSSSSGTSASGLPYIVDKEGRQGWSAIEKEIKKTPNGGTVEVDMNGAKKVPKNIFKEIQGKDIDLVIKMEDGIVWTVNGMTVTDPHDVNLKVTKGSKAVPQKAIDELEDIKKAKAVKRYKIEYSGDFGFEGQLTLPLGNEYDGLYANLFYYNPKTEKLEFVDCDMISDGNADFTLTHASDYVVVISERAYGAYEDAASAAGEYAECDIIA
ncbi:MAG: hypothetical protein ACI4J6_04510 [Oscillospiraceae bacterium]